MRHLPSSLKSGFKKLIEEKKKISKFKDVIFSKLCLLGLKDWGYVRFALDLSFKLDFQPNFYNTIFYRSLTKY